ncbi:spore coat protein GerQ [Ornithinibacillus gellani]|uniref:spore coat protein GerQ n=1 Tax=Ornithinibacillus gellani TaxID=2293253 RepID=UPI000F4AB131|nr:spore coat protein GerQ [Ornithinibacillus gellani]TQS72118.1 spore coat protein GerQ [Ornithinibacillus gellani]
MSKQQEQFGPQAGAYPTYPYYYPAATPAYYPAPYYRQFNPQQQQNQSNPSSGSEMLPMEQSYIENILRLNRGKPAHVYMTFEGQQQKVFTGTIEGAGRDHIILQETKTGKWLLLLMIYLDYVTFDEQINYTYTSPFAGQLSTTQTR